MYNAYITTIKKIRKHNNADRLQIATVFGNDVIVDFSYQIGSRVVYFPTDGELSKEFAEENNLVRKKDENGNNVGGYLDPDKRNIKAIRLRGERSDGLILPISCLAKYTDVDKLKDGERISVLNGYMICKKYIPKRQSSKKTGGENKKGKKEPICEYFAEHVDTEQLAYNLSDFKKGDQIEITLKIHGTSQRTGYLPVIKKYKRNILDLICRRKGKPVYKWEYVSGTRRTILDDYSDGYYGSNSFREPHSKFFNGKLNKGETVYYEVCGFTDSGTPIMPSVSNKKTNDKEFIKKYGKRTTFSYGCDPEGKYAPRSTFYVYRMTMTNEDGVTIEYSPDFIRYRCEQMGCKSVPVFKKCYIENNDDAGEYVFNLANDLCEGNDPIGLTHIREGVVVRIVNSPKFKAYKHKGFNFKVIEGIIKENAEEPDIEEQQEDVVNKENA